MVTKKFGFWLRNDIEAAFISQLNSLGLNPGRDM